MNLSPFTVGLLNAEEARRRTTGRWPLAAGRLRPGQGSEKPGLKEVHVAFAYRQPSDAFPTRFTRHERTLDRWPVHVDL